MKHRAARVIAVALFAVQAATAAASPAQALRARHAALHAQLANNPFQRPIHLESTDKDGVLIGEVHAVVAHPFATLSGVLLGADRWCEIVILHPNVKHCAASRGQHGDRLALHIGRKLDQPIDEAHRVDFDYRVAARSSDHLRVQLNAGAGPLGTHDYRIGVEATPLDARRSFIRMSYSYRYGFAARLAMQGYLATAGRGKVGFTVVGRARDGTPVHVDGMRGVIERNTMRYYLAIDATLDSLAAPPHERVERRLQDWIAATERHARQLRELSPDEYLAIKRREVRRQQAAGSSEPAG